MRFSSGCLALVCVGLVSIVGCTTVGEDTSQSSAEMNATLHEPQGDERKAIFDAFKVQLNADLNGQTMFFDHVDPPGRFFAHGDWAYFDGIIEGPNGNTTPIDYLNSIYAVDFKEGYLNGVKKGGHFAAKFSALAHRESDGTWTFAKVYKSPTYAVGLFWESWRSWASIPPPGLRDIFVLFPVDDLHEPQGAERAAILDVLKTRVTADLHGQSASFNVTDPQGLFLAHDGWAYLDGIIEGPNGNTTPIDYRNSVFAEASKTTAFKGVLRNHHFAAIVRALVKKNKNGSWEIAVTNDGNGYEVGNTTWVGSPGSDWAWDIFGGGKKGKDGEGE